MNNGDSIWFAIILWAILTSCILFYGMPRKPTRSDSAFIALDRLLWITGFDRINRLDPRVMRMPGWREAERRMRHNG